MSLRDLKQNRQQIAEQYAKQFKDKETEQDDRFWYPAVDKVGNGKSIIRFLPAPEGEDSPTVKLARRSFQGPTGKWYSENDLTTIGQEDPVNEINRKLVNGRDWKDVPEHEKAIVRKQKRKEQIICNIYVVKDQLNPENEGKVFLFRINKFIKEKIDAKMNPTFDGEERVNVFCPWEGANFKLSIKTVGNFRNFSDCEFMTPGPLFANDPEDRQLEEIYNKMYPLAPFIAPDQFKTKEELEKRLTEVLGNTTRVSKVEDEDVVVEKPTSKAEKPSWEDDDVDESFFEKIGEID